MSVLKTLETAGPYTTGQSIDYRIAVRNNGPDFASTIVVTDTPTNLTITSVTGFGCVGTTCTLPGIVAGGTAFVLVTATINGPGVFDNSASANAAEVDPDPNNNTDNTGNGGTVPTSADISMVKTLVTSGPFLSGQTVTYSLDVTNAGPDVASAVQVVDTPLNLTITSVSGAGCAALPCTIASIAAGGTANIVVTATIDAAGAFDNTATATGNDPDPVPANNTDSTGNGDTALPSADVSMVKALATPGPYIPGTSVTYTLDVSNAGPGEASAVQVTDTPLNLTITGVSGAGCAALPCTIASIAAGGTANIVVTATINSANPFDNSATAMAAEADPIPANNTDSTNNNGVAGAAADVSIVKTLTTPGLYFVGQAVTYTLTIANAGPATSTGIQVIDIPLNLTFTSVSGACAAMPCSIASLASGASANITVVATIDGAGVFDNNATVYPNETDPVMENNQDATGNSGMAGLGSADLSVVKTSSAPTVAVGTPFFYTVVVKNNGPMTAANVTVTDLLPANFTLSSASSTQGSCSGGAVITCAVGTLVNGATATVTINGQATAPGSLSNRAFANAREVDPNFANSDSTTTVQVTGAGAASIPTASDWGLLAIAMALAALGILHLRLP